MPLSELTVRRRVEFADTDMAGIVHFARYLVFMETAEHAFFRALGSEVHLERDGRRLGWPRVATQCEYFRPLHFGDELEIRVRVVRKGEKSLTFEHFVTRGGERVARGRMTSVCCELEPSGGVTAIPIPPEIAACIAEAPEDGPGSAG